MRLQKAVTELCCSGVTGGLVLEIIYSTLAGERIDDESIARYLLVSGEPPSWLLPTSFLNNKKLWYGTAAASLVTSCSCLS
jgi:hypothetical protein